MNNDAAVNTELINKVAQGVNERDFAFVQSCFTSNFKSHDLAGVFHAIGSGSSESPHRYVRRSKESEALP